MTNIVNISVPKSDNKASVDVDALPQNVRDRLIEIGLSAYIRSAVNSAYATELEKAIKENDAPAREAFEAAEKAQKEANPKYKIKAYKEDPKAAAAFKEAFESVVKPDDVANDRIKALLNGEIRSARGTGTKNSALASLVKANILAVLKSKGKKHRDALAMIGDDPFAFIDKTARKRAGDDQNAYNTELAKLNAQYVDPAKAMLAEPEETEEGEETVSAGADDLI